MELGQEFLALRQRECKGEGGVCSDLGLVDMSHSPCVWQENAHTGEGCGKAEESI